MSSSIPTDGVGDGGSVTNVEDDKKKPWKAIWATLLTLIGTLAVAIDPSAKDHKITGLEALFIIVSTIANGGGTYGIRNPKVRALSRRR